jgi:hypothetical protein
MARRTPPTPAAANDAAAPEPTLEQLRLAYRHMARPGWPSTLEAALQVHTYRICITGLARRMSRPEWKPQPRPLHLVANGATVPPTPTVPPAVPRSRGPLREGPHVPGTTNLGSFHRARPAQWLDVKRLAANDIED